MLSPTLITRPSRAFVACLRLLPPLDGRGTVGMWIPMVHKTQGRQWRHVRLHNQLYQKSATTDLFSTHELDSMGAVPFLTRRSHCIVFHDGWIAPLSPETSGLYLQVVLSTDSSMPPLMSLIPDWLSYRDVFDVCTDVAPTLSSFGQHGKTSLTSQSHSQMPKLSSSELNVWRMMGFPFNRQWRWAYDSTTDHGLNKLPPPVHMFTDLHILPSRMRSLPFHRIHSPIVVREVGALIHMDFHTGLPASRPHGFLHHCSLQDDRSRYGRMIPRHTQTAADALECLSMFQADLQRECGRVIVILAVRCDNVPFGSAEFKEGCRMWKTGPIVVELTGNYAHEQAGRIERFHGVRMATARVLLRYAMVPGTWWPFATNHANLLHNILPNSASRSAGPLQILRGLKVSWKAEHVSVFGHFAMVWLAPPQRGETAKQLADRARPAIYLGRAARIDNSNSRDSHFFMLDEEVFFRAVHFRRLL